VAGHGSGARVLGAEPAGAADAFESLARGAVIAEQDARTICDGLRPIIGQINFELMRAHGVEVITVEDVDTRAAQRLLWQRLKQVVEPSSAIVLAALLKQRARFAGARVGMVLSGGNVEVDALLPD
jgi:threonine dehydratase